MRKYKVGFFKKRRGVFTQDVIGSIENKLKKHENIELFSGLNFSNAYTKNGHVYIDDFDLNTLDIYFWHDTVQAIRVGRRQLFFKCFESFGKRLLGNKFKRIYKNN